MPSYTFGFAAGTMMETTEPASGGRAPVRTLGAGFSADEFARCFRQPATRWNSSNAERAFLSGQCLHAGARRPRHRQGNGGLCRLSRELRARCPFGGWGRNTWRARTGASVVGKPGDLPRLDPHVAERGVCDVYGRSLHGAALGPRRLRASIEDSHQRYRRFAIAATIVRSSFLTGTRLQPTTARSSTTRARTSCSSCAVNSVTTCSGVRFGGTRAATPGNPWRRSIFSGRSNGRAGAVSRSSSRPGSIRAGSSRGAAA